MPSLKELRSSIPELQGLDDESAVAVLHQAYYPDLDVSDVSSALGVKPREPKAEPSSKMRRVLGDTGISLLKGAIGVPEAAVGIADLVTGGGAGRMAEAIGFRPREAKAMLDEALTPEQQRANAEVQQAQGFMGKLGAAVSNPSTVGHTIVESLPSIAAGGVVGRGVMAVAPRLGAGMAGAVGEGAIAAGQNAEQVRQEDPSGALSAKQSAILAASGALTGGLSLLGNKVARALGIGDVDTLLVAGRKAATPAQQASVAQAQKGFVRKVLEGAASEGILEELPQSVQEQVAQNWAQGKPLDENVDYAAVMGLLSGAAMGGIAGPLAKPGDQLRAEGLQPERGPATRALNAAVETAANKVDFDPSLLAAGQKLQGMAGLEQAGTAPGAAAPKQTFGNEIDYTPEPDTGRLAIGDAQQIAAANISKFAAKHDPMPQDYAATLVAKGAESGQTLVAVPHPEGGGFTVVPRQWVTAAMAEPPAQPAGPTVAEQAMKAAESLTLEGDPAVAEAAREARRAQIEAAPVERAPRQRTPEPAAPAPAVPADVVQAYVESRRNDGTPAGRFFATEFDAGRITRDEVQGLIDAARPKSPDQRLAEAAAQAPKPQAPQPGDILNPKGEPFRNQRAAEKVAQREGGSVIVVDGGWSVRPKEADARTSNAPEPGGPAGEPVADARRGARTGELRDQRPADVQVGAAGTADEVRAGDGAAAVQPGRTGPAPELSTDLPTLKRQWQAAVQAGDGATASAINDRIVALKANAAVKPTTEAPASQAAAPGAVAAAPAANVPGAGGGAVEADGVTQSATAATDQAPVKQPAVKGSKKAAEIKAKRAAKVEKEPVGANGVNWQRMPVREGMSAGSLRHRFTTNEGMDGQVLVSPPGWRKGVNSYVVSFDRTGGPKGEDGKTKFYPTVDIGKYRTEEAARIAAEKVIADNRVAAKTPAPAAPESAASTTQGEGHGQTQEEAQGLLKKEAPADVTTAGATATHADPGEAAEPATPAVVAESITKAAKREDRKPSEMKADLLRQIDAKLADAQDEYLPTWKAPTKDQIRKARVGTGTTNEARIVQMLENQHRNRVLEIADRIGYVMFDVPGDGKFKVLNTKSKLTDFRRQVESSPGFKNTSSAPKPEGSSGGEKGYGGAKAAIEGMIDEGDAQAAVDYAAMKGLDLAEVLKGQPERLKKVQGLTPTGEAEEAPAVEPAPAPAAEPTPAAPKQNMPPLPVNAYRVERRYANGAVIRPLPGKIFTDDQAASIANWFSRAGWEVSSQKPSGVSAVNNIGMSVDDVPEPYTAKQRQRDEAQQAADASAAAKREEQQTYLQTSPAGQFVVSRFGDAINGYNATALAKYLDGSSNTFGGLLSNRAADALESLGIKTEGRQVKDILTDLKREYERLQAAPKQEAAAEPPAPQQETYDGAMRGRAWALVKDGRVLRSGSEPSMAPASEGNSEAYFRKMADDAGADLYVGRPPVANDDGQERIFGLTWAELQAAQQRTGGRATVQGRMPEGAVLAYSPAPQPEKQEAAPAENRLDNFGEALPPARRNMAAKLTEDLADDDIARRPLSEIWPLAENDAIEDTFAAAVAHAARAEIPSKPRQPYKLRLWVEKVKTLRGLAGRIVSGEVTRDRMGTLIDTQFRSLRDWWSKVQLLGDVSRDQWKRIGSVEERPDAIAYEDGKQVQAPTLRIEIDGKGKWLHGDVGVDGAARGTVGGNKAGIMAMLAAAEPEQRMKFEIRRNTNTGEVFINKEGDAERRRLMTFASVEEARKAIAEQYDELVSQWEGVKARDNITERDLRGAENRPRAGRDWRAEAARSRVVQALVESSDADAKAISRLLVGQSGTAQLPSKINVPGSFGLADWPNNAGSVNTVVRERPSYMAAVSANLLRNLAETESFSVQIRGERNVPLVAAVQEAMLTLGEDAQVLGAVVKRVPVEVVDFLARKKIPTEGLFRNESVFKSLLAVEGGMPVRAGRDDPVVSLVRAVAGDRAKVVDADDPARVALEADSALVTGKIHSGLAESLFSHDVSPQEFQARFSFRGGEFGKWVEQGKGDKERQALLNSAFDALMDLSDMLHIPPRAISLNGTLGIAFGSRGSGWASAHFEPSNLVINLTKTRGAGALAHEWFHALDNYFSRLRRDGEEAKFTGDKDKYRNDNYITHQPEALMVRKDRSRHYSPMTASALKARHAARQQKESRTGWPPADAYAPENWERDPSIKTDVRPEVEVRFADLVKALNDSPMTQRSRRLDKGSRGYWGSTLERAARAFENFVQARMQEQGYHNDFLANVLPVEEMRRNPERYPYLLPGEVKPIADAFDALFSEVKTREDDAGNVAMFSRGGASPGRRVDLASAQALADQLASTGLIRLNVVQSVSDMPLNLQRQLSKSAPDGRVRGAYFRGTDEVWMVADHIRGANEFVEVALHEAFHRGLGKTIPDAKPLLREIWRTNQNVRKATADQMRQHGIGRDEAIEEALAKMAEAGEVRDLKGWPKLLEAIRTWLGKMARAVGVEMVWTDDMVADLVAASTREGLKAGVHADVAAQAVAADRGQRVQTETEAFKRWFGDSKVVDASGKPLVVYHGTTDDISVFKRDLTTDGGFHFGDSAQASMRVAGQGGRNIMPVYLSIENPRRSKDAGGKWASKIKAAKSDGHDGIVYLNRYEGIPQTAFQRAVEQIAKERGGNPDYVRLDALSDEQFRRYIPEAKDSYIAFRPEQIKSAIGNSGNYDPANPDIRAKRAPTVTVETDEATGAPVYATDDISIGFPQETERFEYVLQDGEKIVNYSIGPADGFDSYGFVELVIGADGIPKALADIEVKPELRGQAIGEKVMAAILGAHPGTDIEISNIVEGARGFWAKMGVPEQNRAAGEAYDGTLNYQTFQEAQDERAANRAAAGRGAAGEGRNARAEGRAQGADGQAQGLMLSRAEPADATDMRAAPVVRQIQQRAHDLLATRRTFNWWHRTVGTQFHKAQVDADFGRVYTAAQDYLHDTSAFANDSADLAPDLLPQLKSIGDLKKTLGLNKRDRERMAAAVFEGTLVWMRDDSGQPVKAGPDDTAGIVWTPAELRERFGFNDRQVGLYEQFRASVDRSLDTLVASDVARLLGDELPAGVRALISSGDLGRFKGLVTAFLQDAPGMGELAEQVAEKYDRIEDLKARGYAPLMRFGRYTVDVVSGDGERKFFGLYESESEANRAARQFKEGADPGDEVTQGVLSEEAYKQFQGMTPETLELFAEVAGVEKNEIFQEYLRRAKNNRSALKRLIHRKGIAGYSEDASRVLAQFLTSNARASSTNLHMGEMAKAVQDIPKQKGDVIDEAIRLREYVQTPQEEAQAIRGLLFMSFLGGSVASAMVNLTQPLMMTLPYLSQFGGPAAAAGRLAAAVKAALGSYDRDSALGKALAMAEKEGIVSPQELHQLQAEASGSLAGHPALRRLTFAWGSLFSAAEQFNRRLSFIAAFNTAVATGQPDPAAFAVRAVEETQGIYNKGNKPRWARGAVGATVFTFKQYSVSYMEFLKRLPTRERTMALAVLLLAAGAQGMPGADDLDDLIDTLGQGLGYDTNAKMWKTRVLSEAIGSDGADFVLRGFSALPGFPLDVAGRLGLGNMIPGTGLLMKSKQDKAGEVAEALGPAASLASGVAKAVPALAGGNLGGVLEGIAPKGIKDLAKALEMYQTGEYRDTKGRKVTDADATDALVKGLGFQPAQVARDSRRVQMANQQIALAKATEAEFADAIARARVDGDPDAELKARQRLADWNASNPESRIVITPAQLARRARELRTTRDDRFVRTAPKEMRQSIKELVQ